MPARAGLTAPGRTRRASPRPPRPRERPDDPARGCAPARSTGRPQPRAPSALAPTHTTCCTAAARKQPSVRPDCPPVCPHQPAAGRPTDSPAGILRARRACACGDQKARMITTGASTLCTEHTPGGCPPAAPPGDRAAGRPCLRHRRAWQTGTQPHTAGTRAGRGPIRELAGAGARPGTRASGRPAREVAGRCGGRPAVPRSARRPSSDLPFTRPGDAAACRPAATRSVFRLWSAGLCRPGRARALSGPGRAGRQYCRAGRQCCPVGRAGRAVVVRVKSRQTGSRHPCQVIRHSLVRRLAEAVGYSPQAPGKGAAPRRPHAATDHTEVQIIWDGRPAGDPGTGARPDRLPDRSGRPRQGRAELCSAGQTQTCGYLWILWISRWITLCRSVVQRGSASPRPRVLACAPTRLVCPPLCTNTNDVTASLIGDVHTGAEVH